MRFLHSFHTRMIIGSLCMILLTLVIATSVIFERYEASLSGKIQESTLQSFSIAGSKINEVLKEARNAARETQKMKTMEEFFFGTFSSRVEKIQTLRTTLSSLNTVLNSHPELNALFLFSDQASMIGVTRSWSFHCEEQLHPMAEVIEQSDLSTYDRITWLGLLHTNDFMTSNDVSSYNEDLVIGAYQTKYRYSFTDKARYVTTFFSVNPEALSNCFDVLKERDQEIFLLDDKGRQLIGPSKADGGEIPWFYHQLNEADEMQGLRLTYEACEYQLLFHRLEGCNWMLVKKIPQEIYYESLMLMKKATYAISISVLIFMLIPYVLWLLYLCRPFKSISAALERMKRRDLSVRLEKKYQLREFELIRSEFNSMADSIVLLLNQTKEMEHQRIELELRNLQSQLNPHMIFNSITAIRWVAMISGADKVSDMLVELAELIRPVFAEWRVVWPMSDELNYLGHYVKLLRLRYGGGIQIEIQIDEDMKEILLPCFTFQPLIENSVEHGIGARGMMMITINGRREGDKCMITLSDNGLGMSAEKLATIRQKIQTGDMPDQDPRLSGLGHTGIGLTNLHRRLCMFSGGESGLEISSEENVGTTVRICIPVHPGSI